MKVFDGNIPYRLLFTGQHVDLLKNIDRDIQKLTILSGDNRLDSIVTSLLNKDYIFDEITSVLVQGDTTSAFSIA